MRFFTARSFEFSISKGNLKAVDASLRCAQLLRSGIASTPQDSDEMWVAFAVSAALASQKDGKKANRSANRSTGHAFLSPAKFLVSVARS